MLFDSCFQLTVSLFTFSLYEYTKELDNNEAVELLELPCIMLTSKCHIFSLYFLLVIDSLCLDWNKNCSQQKTKTVFCAVPLH